MATSPITTIFNEVVDFLAAGRSPQEIIDFEPSEDLKQRSHYLLEQNRKGTLTPEEHSEVEELLRMNHFVNMLKIRARQKLTDS